MREVPHTLSWVDWEGGGGSHRGRGRSKAGRKGPMGCAAFHKQAAGPQKAGVRGAGQETAPFTKHLGSTWSVLGSLRFR